MKIFDFLSHFSAMLFVKQSDDTMHNNLVPIQYFNVFYILAPPREGDVTLIYTRIGLKRNTTLLITENASMNLS